MVKLSRKMKAENGVLPEVPALSKGKVISEELKTTVKTFYESDEISRQCPGKKDYVSIRTDEGNKIQVQKCLIFCNLKEAFLTFKQEELNTIGFSSFCSLRPKHCVLAGSAGTHSVYVCTRHQNSKLLLNGIGQKDLILDDLMAKAVCEFG